MNGARAELYRRLPPTTDLPWWESAVAAAPGGTVLYLGAGTGRLAVPLARRARRLVAVESDAAMVGALRSAVAAEPASPPIEIVTTRAADLDVEEFFGLVLLPSNLLNEVVDPVERDATMAIAGRCCRGDGRVILQVLNPYWVASGTGGRGWLAGVDGREVAVEVTDPHFDLWEQHHRAVVNYRFPDGDAFEDHLDAVALFPGDLRRVVAGAGLEIVERWGARPGRDGLSARDGTWHLVCVPSPS